MKQRRIELTTRENTKKIQNISDKVDEKEIKIGLCQTIQYQPHNEKYRNGYRSDINIDIPIFVIRSRVALIS